jgi:hypothetical protein
MYFDMKKRKEIQDELKELESSLQDMDNKTQYDIPASYFDEMQEKVLSRMQIEPVAARKVSRMRSIKWLMASAAILLVLFGSLSVIQSEKAPLDIEDLTDEQIFAYLEDEMGNIYPEELLDYIPEDSWVMTEGIDYEEAEKYLDEYLFEFSLEELNNY